MIEYALKLDFPTMNSEVEYKALIAGLGLARAVRAKNLKIYGDSRLVVAKVNGEFEAKDDTMAKYLRVLKGILTQFDEWYAKHVLRKENTTTDALSKFASFEIENYPISIYFQVQKTPTIYVINLIAPIGVASCWIDPIKTHLETGWLPDDAQETQARSDSSKSPERLTSISTPIIFAMWGIDIFGPFSVASGHRKFIVKRVKYSRNSWVDGLLPILWAYHTTCKVTTEATPFMLAYGAEAVVPLEITHGSSRVEAYESETNKEGMRLALFFIDEIRDEAKAHNAKHQRRTSFYYNRRVNERFFQQGDLVLKKIEASGVGEKGKLSSNWEGPYKARKTLE
ncbi:uncharacterized protein LOC141664940 [Apium graveolens]|uniref:uncharacterized protein LOC141664940 n=1 Tax=Apium graveolens TaxID=4045 RepID=UPI003D7BD9DA